MPSKTTSDSPKAVQTPQFLTLLTWTCVSRHNCVHFSTSERQKVVRTLELFYTFDFDICFAPQRRALFRHLNFQKWSERGVLLPFLLTNVLRATTACTLSTSQLPKVVQTWCALHILIWKCASHHNGVHFFDLSTSKSGSNLACFVHFDLEICFAPQRRAIFHLSSGQLAPHTPLLRAYFSTLQSPKSLKKTY